MAQLKINTERARLIARHMRGAAEELDLATAAGDQQAAALVESCQEDARWLEMEADTAETDAHDKKQEGGPADRLAESLIAELQKPHMQEKLRDMMRRLV